MNGARLIARPSAHSVLFETADGGGVVYWQKLILCCTGGLQAVADDEPGRRRRDEYLEQPLPPAGSVSPKQSTVPSG
ncbi:hypothetical protein [Klebsiella variicola]|uniref:hypothetical protein n=1 Tax=Klebsiella variicola TaxID=244366 RepID=UPI00203BCB47|nr:hypothetical protein [Klebsiella variicola]